MLRRMWSNGNSFGASMGNALAPGTHGEGGTPWPVPPWKFGLRQSDDRGSL